MHSLIGDRPGVQCTAAPYGTPASAAGTWLVVNAFGSWPGYANPPLAACVERRCVSAEWAPLLQAAPAGSCPAAIRAWMTIASESGSLAGGPQTEEFWYGKPPSASCWVCRYARAAALAERLPARSRAMIAIAVELVSPWPAATGAVP